MVRFAKSHLSVACMKRISEKRFEQRLAPPARRIETKPFLVGVGGERSFGVEMQVDPMALLMCLIEKP